MAETLTELVAKIIVDAAELKKGLDEATAGVQSWVKENEKQFKAVGAALTGIGVAITGSLGMMTKDAIDEEVNVNRLAITLKNLGVEYDDVKDSLEGVILATQRKTGIADNAQRDILGRLLLVTNDYNKALELMPTVLDLAAAGQMDATTAATYLGKAYLELQENEQKRIDIQAQLTTGTIDLETAQSELGKITDTVSVRFGQASLKFKDMEEIQKRVAGASEATANPLNILQASMGDLAEKIGSFLLPVLKDIVDKVVPIIEKVQAWTDAHPELTRVLVILAAVLGGVALVLGPLLIMLPLMVAGIGLLLGPIGLVVAAIMGIIAIGTLLVLNWDWIKAKTAEIWNSIVGFLKGVWDNIVSFFQENWDKILAILFPTIGLPILIARNWDTIRENTIKIWDGIKNFFMDVWQNIVSIFKNHWQLILAILFPAVGLPLLIAKHWGKITQIVSDIWDGVIGGIKSAWGNVVSFVSSGVNWLIEKVNSVITLINKVPGVDIGEIGKVEVPKMAEGGIVTRPTLAMIGEAGAEAVIPLKSDKKTPRETIRTLPQLAGGGIVTQPTLAMVGEAGAEALVPLNETSGVGNITINFTQPVFFDREDTMNKFVDMIRKGIQRQDRLRFGGAFNG